MEEGSQGRGKKAHMASVSICDLDGNAVKLHLLHQLDQVRQIGEHLGNLKVVPVALNPLLDHRTNSEEEEKEEGCES